MALNGLSVTVSHLHLPGTQHTSPKEEIPESHPTNMTLQTLHLKTDTVHRISTWSFVPRSARKYFTPGYSIPGKIYN